MSVLSAQTIRNLCDHTFAQPMITPFYERREIFWYKPYGGWLDTSRSKRTAAMLAWIEDSKPKRFSYGLSTCGYDVRLAQDMWLWPFWGRLASTIERFHMPSGVMAEVKDKSSWARRFVTVQNTVIEPGWRGTLTLELTNHRLWPVRLRKGSPIAQIVFYRLDEPSEMPYAGKYQDQEPGPQPAR